MFDAKYKRLNTAQRLAVDTVEGPVIVIAGPGTGKTELLSMRVANILRKTDALPENILCLTFTESGAAAMRERLTDLMGKEAYHVSVNTFHSFGSEIINKYSDYFYSGASFQPADELATHQILVGIFDKLPHSDLLAKKMNGEYTQLRYVQNSISDFKKSGLTADEIQRILLDNTRFMDHAEPLLSSFFNRAMSSSMWQELPSLIKSISLHKEKPLDVRGVKKLSTLFLAELTQLYEENKSQKKTTALTAWRNKWLEKDEKARFIFKDRKRQEKLYSASVIYYQYLTAMLEAGLYDYDDMILRVVHALEVFPDLRYNLQEQYQYILVDEFQDTNGAQLRILLSLIDGTNEGRPNILVVGDDDQAIYSFQGAELSNITTLQTSVVEPMIVPLTDNYRSSKQILTASRTIITQGIDRLENRVESLNKELTPCRDIPHSKVELHEYESQEQEYSAIAEDIASRLKQGQKGESIAILARGHKDIRSLLPYLASHTIPVSYEHRDNVLESPPVVALLSFARTIDAISKANLAHANTLLPELLSQPFWNLRTQDLWQLSLNAYTEKKLWLEVMLESSNPQLRDIALLLTELAYKAPHQSLEYTLDQLIGTVPVEYEERELTSPFKEYYFNETKIVEQPLNLSDYLSALRHLRMSLREYRAEMTLHLTDFVAYIDQSIAAGLRFMVTIERDQDETGSIHVMTAHKSKGLEFETVYIINATDTTWGSRSRGGVSRLSYPENIAIAPAGETADERLRLFFVAMTRAKRELYISYPQKDERGKPMLKSEFLSTDDWNVLPKKAGSVITNKETILHWTEKVSHPGVSLHAALASRLKNYYLSATHLNAFLDVSRGGPRGFLLQNLLHFPQSIPPSAAFGSAVHNTLRHAQEHLNTSGEKRPVEDSLYDFESYLRAQHLEEDDYKRQLQKGSDILPGYLAAHDNDFIQGAVTERDFRSQGVVVGEARLTGILDRLYVNTNERTTTVIDFKTGSPASTWKGKTDYEKIKLHKYRQQLMFYKLLIEHSRDYKNYSTDTLRLSFIEPTPGGEFHDLEANFTDDDLKTFTRLINKVWQHIIAADFPDTSSYEQNYKGIVAFEENLINS